jgi:purine-binding chemotaxis protein CheW
MAGIETKVAAKYLCFMVGAEEFGVDIGNIIEIIRVQHITGVPDKPEYIKGVINLRGKIIPVVDARLKLGLEYADYGELTCIVVIRTQGELIGIIVDSVNEVIAIKNDDIGNHEMITNGRNEKFISGIGKTGDKMTLLLDVVEFLKS